MGIDNKIVYKRILFTALSLLCVCFVFSRSFKPGNKSGEESGKVLEFLNSIANLLGLGNVFTHNLVRKCAHFTEFTVLAVLFFNMYNSFFIRLKKISCLCAGSYFLVAVTDEVIQYFVPGRACQFTDVLIDFSGGTFGLALSIALCLIFRKSKSKSKSLV